MRIVIFTIILMSAGGCASPATDIAPTTRPPAEKVIRLAEAQSEGRYYFYTGREGLIFHNGDSNVMVYVDHGIYAIDGLSKWTDYYGRIHTLDILKQQLAFNSYLWQKQNPYASLGDNHAAVMYTEVKPVLVTGLLDRDTLLIPARKFEIKLQELEGQVKSAKAHYQYEFADKNFSAELPAGLTALLIEGDNLLKEAHTRLRQYEEIMQGLPLHESNYTVDRLFPDDMDSATRFFSEDRDKPTPDERPDWAVRSKFGLGVPVPLTSRDTTLRDLESRGNFQRLENGLQVRVLVSGRQPEDLVMAYAVASELGPHLKEMNDAEDAVEECLLKIEAQYTSVAEWFAQRKLLNSQSPKPVVQ